MTHLPNIEWYVGIDEAGRGPLAGPVTLGFCAVTSHGLRNDDEIKKMLVQMRDSKQLSEKQRESLHALLKKNASNPHIITTTVSITADKIEKKGIVWAISFAIAEGLRRLGLPPESAHILLDGGLRAPIKFSSQETIIKGDVTEPLISAASIVAKVTRDRHMTRMAKKFPHYGFAKHKGYGTKAHREAVKKYGACEIHRTSWIK